MYEYHAAYKGKHGDKLTYIPLPIKLHGATAEPYTPQRKLRFFIGIQKSRSVYKGTDIMLRALERIEKEYPEECTVMRAENVPFEQYSQMIDECDVLLDQLYGYSPGMNALLAMSKGKIVVGGAEEECYNILNEKELRPIVNVTPDEESVYSRLKWLLDNKETIAGMQRDSLEFISKHHTPEKVAHEYLKFWESK